MNIYWQIISVLLLPLLASLITFFLRKKVFSPFLGIVSSTGGLLLSIILVKEIAFSKIISFKIYEITLGQFDLKFDLMLDRLGVSMLVLVYFIALLVQLFSLSYMKNEKDKGRYFALLSFFIFAMLGIILSNNLLFLYLFWELVGLSSFLLIGFWYHKPQAAKAAQKAFLLNKSADIGFLFGILSIIYIGGSTEFTQLGLLADTESSTVLTTIGLLLFCGCIGKSAQFPLHSWLPDAMEGPTPVSALIHAAMMVAAGIYLLARIQPILTIDAQFVIAIIGTITMLLGSLYAIFQTDIKKILAYSTLSQSGLMVLGLGSSSSVYHLFTHAFVKAGLFLGAGSIIYSLHQLHLPIDEQQLGNMGNLKKKLPLTFFSFTIFSLALIGLPFFAPFLSKELILNTLYSQAVMNDSVFYQGFIGATFFGFFLTSFYVFRLNYFVFWRENRLETFQFEAIKEGKLAITFPLMVLSICSFFFCFSKNPFATEGNWLLEFWNLSNEKKVENHYFPFLSMLMILGGITAGFLSRRNELSYKLISMDFFYDKFVLKPVFFLAKFASIVDASIVDKLVNELANLNLILAKILAWFDGAIVDGMVHFGVQIIRTFGQIFRSIQAGKVQLYVFWAFVGVIGLGLCLFWMI